MPCWTPGTATTPSSLTCSMPCRKMDWKRGSWTAARRWHRCLCTCTMCGWCSSQTMLPNSRDRNPIAAMLNESASAVREAVKGRLQSGREMELHYDHPILFLQHMIWHEGYHHGQIKLALKMAGHPFDDEGIGPVTWDVWMDKTHSPKGR